MRKLQPASFLFRSRVLRTALTPELSSALPTTARSSWAASTSGSPSRKVSSFSTLSLTSGLGSGGSAREGGLPLPSVADSGGGEFVLFWRFSSGATSEEEIGMA